MTREFYYAPHFERDCASIRTPPRQKEAERLAPLLPKISDAIAQFIKPIASNAQGHRYQSFQRFGVPNKDEKKGEENPGAGDDQPESNRPQSNVVPIRPNLGTRTAANLPILGFLLSLSDSRKYLVGIGRRLYAKMRREQDKRKSRKGIALDIKA